jgi:hypothetical protein
MATKISTAGRSQLNLVNLSARSQLALRDYLCQCQMLSFRNWNIRQVMRDVDLLYAREMDLTEENIKAQRANRYGNSNKFQNIQVPVVLPTVEASVTYQTSVFLTGVPLFGVDASPDYQEPAKQMEALIDQQAIRGGWTRHFMMSFRDGFKYNLAPMEISWERYMLPDFTTRVQAGDNSVVASQIAWEGNVVKRWDPYNTFWDIRYGVTEVASRGEFVGNNDLISRVELKKLVASSPFIIRNNIKPAFESPQIGISFGSDFSQLSYYIPQISQFQSVDPTIAQQFNWMAWSGLERTGANKSIEYKNIYQKTTLYAEIIPSDFDIDVPARNTPQRWKFIFINNNVLIYAQPLSLAYDSHPVLFGCPNEDGLKYQTKSVGKNSGDFQSVASAMMNSVIHARRKAISDRTIYDPSRITEAQINSDNPSAKIPVRPAAYGKPVSDSVYAFPFRDDQSGLIMQEMPQILEMNMTLQGQNRAKQGQFVKGNKTRREFESVMANANGRDQMMSIGWEAQVFTPMKDMLKTNILQFQTPATVYSRELKETVNVDPVALRQAALVFKVSDGLIPAEKLINGDSLSAALNAIGTTPALAQGYNMAPMFSYLMKSQGAELSPFEKSPAQMAYEQAMQAWQGTVQMLIEAQVKAGQAPDLTKAPPQPTPQAYGYIPGAPSPSEQARTGGAPIVAQYQTITDAKNNPANQQAPAQ